MLETVKYLINGGGITGLSFANFLKNDNYLILEKENQVGGYCKTFYNKDFVWDYAGHFFHFNNKKIKDFFMNELSMEELVYKNKNTKIYLENSYVDYPFQKNIHQLSKDKFIECLYYLFNKVEKKEYNNFEDMLYGKFGKGITEFFLKPYNEKLYACDLNNLDSDAMGRFFPYADLRDIINNMKIQNNNSYNNEFFYPKKGAQVFVNILKEKLKNEKIYLNEEIIELDQDNKIAITNKRKIKYEYLINTTSLQTFDAKIKQNNLNEFKGNKVLVLNLGFDSKTNIKDIHWIYFPEKEINFYRVGFYDNILDSNKGSLYVEIGLNDKDEFNIKEELEKTIQNLKKTGVISEKNRLESYNSILMEPAYVHISTQNNELVKKLKEEYKNKKIYTIGRYGSWTYCSIEDCMLEAINLVEKLEKGC